MKTSKIRHIATGTDHDVPKEIVALGGVETTRWIENKMQEEALQQSLKIAAAEEAARAETVQAEKSEIEALKEIVLAQQAQLDHFQQNFVQSAPTDAMTAARDLMAASAHATALRDSARSEMDAIKRFREEHASELGEIKDLLASKRQINEQLRERNALLMQRAASGDPEAAGELNAIAMKGGGDDAS